ncbi:hypothetical protein [Undibacterium umbellatum]|uniref:Uncharacterized protein n=1 Tax=Undibacterium umbellatum TaxID=2762300 RepID=A0ABR6Z4H2_9BURK|nr:hypothetical protein [Undibacterium umbellatum]MBC3906642.1 hypothetical protein [Undibacterium umbellatum]
MGQNKQLLKANLPAAALWAVPGKYFMPRDFGADSQGTASQHFGQGKFYKKRNLFTVKMLSNDKKPQNSGHKYVFLLACAQFCIASFLKSSAPLVKANAQ